MVRDEVTPALFQKELDAGTGNITVWINFPGGDVFAAAQVSAQKDIYFIIRYCSEVSAMDTEHYRILFRGQVYDITFIDNVRYQNRMLKLRASLAKR